MSLRFPLLWEVGNLVVIVAKGVTFLVGGAPFREAWLLLGLCAASIALELVSRVSPQPAVGVRLFRDRLGGGVGGGLQQPPMWLTAARHVCGSSAATAAQVQQKVVNSSASSTQKHSNISTTFLSTYGRAILILD